MDQKSRLIKEDVKFNPSVNYVECNWQAIHIFFGGDINELEDTPTPPTQIIVNPNNSIKILTTLKAKNNGSYVS